MTGPATPAGTVVCETPPGRRPAGWARRDPRLGTVVVVPEPGHANDASLGRQVLSAVGVRAHLKGNAEQQSQRNPALAAVWLAAHRTRHLVVASPTDTTAAQVETLGQIATAGGATLVLVCDPGTGTRTADTVAARGLVTVLDHGTVQTMITIAETGTGEEPAHVLDGWGPADLPPADFASWRGDTRRTIPADVFAALDAVYVEARAAAHGLALAGPVTARDVDDLVRDRCRDHPTQAEGVAIVRGVQAGTFREGWLIQADHNGLLAGLARGTGSRSQSGTGGHCADGGSPPTRPR